MKKSSLERKKTRLGKEISTIVMAKSLRHRLPVYFHFTQKWTKITKGELLSIRTYTTYKRNGQICIQQRT
jgi:hypothetical protein